MPTILYRKSLTEDSELEIMSRHFPVTDSMVGIKNDLVIGRYSAVPFYSEVCKGLELQGSYLINSLRQHTYIANFDYYYDIEKYTPKTWFRLQDVPEHEAPFFVKGKTTSKKHSWNTMAYAETRADAIRVATDLKNDYYIGAQDIIVRKYEPLIKLGEGINGLPWTNEWRFFFYKRELLTYGFYWSECEIKGTMTDAGIAFAHMIADIISEHTNFYTIDIGQKVDGSFIIIEINDAQMAGFSECSIEELYSNLAKTLKC